jgi:hypothetical protein
MMVRKTKQLCANLFVDRSNEGDMIATVLLPQILMLQVLTANQPKLLSVADENAVYAHIKKHPQQISRLVPATGICCSDRVSSVCVHPFVSDALALQVSANTWFSNLLGCPLLPRTVIIGRDFGPVRHPQFEAGVVHAGPALSVGLIICGVVNCVSPIGCHIDLLEDNRLAFCMFSVGGSEDFWSRSGIWEDLSGGGGKITEYHIEPGKEMTAGRGLGKDFLSALDTCLAQHDFCQQVNLS